MTRSSRKRVGFDPGSWRMCELFACVSSLGSDGNPSACAWDGSVSPRGRLLSHLSGLSAFAPLGVAERTMRWWGERRSILLMTRGPGRRYPTSIRWPLLTVGLPGSRPGRARPAVGAHGSARRGSTPRTTRPLPSRRPRWRSRDQQHKTRPGIRPHSVRSYALAVFGSSRVGLVR